MHSACQHGDQLSDPCCVVVVTGVGSMGFADAARRRGAGRNI